jgi:hypothetical protein
LGQFLHPVGIPLPFSVVEERIASVCGDIGLSAALHHLSELACHELRSIMANQAKISQTGKLLETTWTAVMKKVIRILLMFVTRRHVRYSGRRSSDERWSIKVMPDVSFALSGSAADALLPANPASCISVVNQWWDFDIRPIPSPVGAVSPATDARSTASSSATTSPTSSESTSTLPELFAQVVGELAKNQIPTEIFCECKPAGDCHVALNKTIFQVGSAQFLFSLIAALD